MTPEQQTMAQALFDIEMELDLHDGKSEFLDKLWDIIHAPDVWDAVMKTKGDE